jgi:hypothetical protein
MRFQTAPKPGGRCQLADTCAPSTEGQMNKFNLQIVMRLVGIIPVATGLLGMMGVDDPVYVAAGVPPIVLLDTNLRFFSGAWVGLGLALYWLIPTIERQTVLFRVLWGMIFIGGIGRLLSMIMLGLPPVAFVAFTAIEIVGAPLFIWWQFRVSNYEPSRVNDGQRPKSPPTPELLESV